MKTIITLTIASVVALCTAYGAAAAEFTKGTVKKVDAKAKKVTLIHEELKALDMPAMTMVFRSKDPSALDKLKVGDTLRFKAEKVDGVFTLTEFKPAS